MNGERCFETTAPEHWFAVALGLGVVAVAAAGFSMMLWLKPAPTEDAPSRGYRAIWAAPGFLGLLPLIQTGIRDGWRALLPGVALMGALLLASVPVVAVTGRRVLALRTGQPLNARWSRALLLTRIGTVMVGAAALLGCLAVMTAYLASSVEVPCS